MNVFLVLLAAYLLGAIPFGYLAAKICGKDIFKIGSGSIGTTNVIRACGTLWGIIVLILDVLKGTMAIRVAAIYLPNQHWLIMTAGLLAMVGHSASIFIKFRGGKAAATGIGVLLALNPLVSIVIGCLVFLLRQFTGYQSVASLAGALLAPILFIYYAQPLPYIILTLIGCAFVWYKHLPNIQRLRNGTETKITKGKKQ